MPAANCCETSYRYLWLDDAGQWHFEIDGDETEEEVKFCPFCGTSLETVKRRIENVKHSSKFEKCDTCDGCGKLANTEDREPWSRWLELPVRSAIALQVGIVTPITCPDCKGAGKIQQKRLSDFTTFSRKRRFWNR